MSDFTLNDGREVTFDLNAFTIGEWRKLFADDSGHEYEDTVIAKATGLSVDDIQGLGYAEWKRMTRAFFEKVRHPIVEDSADPN